VHLPKTAHTSRPWRIHGFTHDFRLEDVWALPTPGEPDDFQRLVRLLASWDPAKSSSFTVRALFAIRGRAGELLGWDETHAASGDETEMVRDRLPADLRNAATGPKLDVFPFRPVYLLADEWALEVANRTVHGVLHVGWVRDDRGGYRGQLAILVKRNGRLGTVYMAAIAPFRHLLVYPRILGELEREWRRPG
jgi:hypothetical protein